MNIHKSVKAVSAADPAMAEIIKRAGPFQPPPSRGDPFGYLAQAIMFQQLAGRAAQAIHGRFVQAIGGRVTPQAVLAVTPEVLRTAGLSGNKTASIIDLATKATDGTVPLDRLGELDDEEVISRLSTVRGIGRWTSEMFMIFEMGRLDVWPVVDFGVRNGWTLMHSLPKMITPRQLQLEGDRFRPYRTIAAWYCWQAVRVLRGEMALPDSTSAGAPTARTATGASGTRVSAPAPQRAASETCVRIRSGVRQSQTSVTPRGSARTWFASRHGWLRRHSCLADLHWLQTESG